MKKLYLDVTEAEECMAVYIKDAEIIRAGATIYSMPVKDNNAEYKRYADEYDIHFIFDNDVPQVDFYTVPQVDIIATDSCGGFIGTVGQTTDFQSDALICYIDRFHNCYLIAGNAEDFIKCAAIWKNCLKKYDGITFFKEKSEAEKVFEFIDWRKIRQDLTQES